MPATHSVSIRKKLLYFGFCLYAILNLGSMATMSIGAGLLALALILSSSSKNVFQEIQKEWGRRESKFYLWLSFLLAGACILSLLVAKVFPLYYNGSTSIPHLFKDSAKLWYLIWPFFLVIGLRRLSTQERQTILKIWLITCGILSLIGIAQFFTGWPRPREIPSGYGHYFHTTLFFGHHLSVASIFIFPFFTALDLAWNERSKKSFYLWIAFFTGITLILTFARTLWIALPIGIFLWLLWSLPKKLAAIFSGFLLISAVALLQIPQIYHRITLRMGLPDRENLWKANLEFFQQRPLTGVGWRHNQELSGYYLMEKLHSTNVFSGHAHNNLLDMLSGTGLCGALAWILWCGGVIWILKKRPRSSTQISFGRGLLCAWIVFHINGMTQVNFWEAKVEHQVAWIIAWALL